MKAIFYLLILAAALVGAAYWWDHGADQGTGKAHAEFGTLPDASDAMAAGDPGQMTYSYTVTLDYPAQAELDFYGQKMAAKGWSPLNTNMFGPPDQWGSSPNVDPETRKPACEFKYVTVWASQDKGRVAVLALVYFDPSANGACAATPKVRRLRVTLEELPMPKG